MVGKYSLKEVLAQQPDTKCVCCGVGFYQNLSGKKSTRCPLCIQKHAKTQEQKESARQYIKNYYRTRPEQKEKLKEYHKIYNSRPKNKERQQLTVMERQRRNVVVVVVVVGWS